MSARDPVVATSPEVTTTEQPLPDPIAGALVCELIALADEGRTPVVGVPAPWLCAAVGRTTIELRAADIGQQAVVVFERGDAARPVVVGLLRREADWPLPDAPSQVEITADGAHVTVRAAQQLVLACGRASITLTRAGKVLIRGAYVLSHSSGVNRIKGGSVQIN